MVDIRRMTLGQVVDHIISYNERHKEAEESTQQDKDKQGKKVVRQATQADINAFFG